MPGETRVGTRSVFLAPDATLDLHMHTRASDGRWTPETLVEKAASLGLRVMAVADHDAVDSVAPVAELAAARGIAAITGVEVTTRWDGRQWHVLIYGADLAGTAFRALVDESRRRHVDAAERAVAGLRAGGYRVPSLAGAIDGRPPLPIYVMSALVRDGHAVIRRAGRAPAPVTSGTRPVELGDTISSRLARRAASRSSPPRRSSSVSSSTVA